MEPKKNLLKRISSKVSLKLILSYILYRKKLIFFQYSKEFQTLLGINIFTYQKLYIFNTLTIQKVEDKIELYYKHKKNSLLNLLLKKGIKDSNEQNKILTKYFLDIYTEYSKNIYIIIDDLITDDEFLNLISIKAPIKIKLTYDFDHTENQDTFMKILEHNDKINSINFDFPLVMEYFEIDLLTKLNELNNLDEISISCELFYELVEGKFNKFFENNFKIIEVFTFNEDNLIKFCSSLEKIKYILNKNKNLNTLKIKNDDEYPEKDLEGNLNLNNMLNIKKLELNKLYINCQMNNEFSNNLIDLSIDHTYMNYKDGKKIQFSNLKKLCIKDISLSKFLIDYSSLSNLEYLSVELNSYKDFIFLIKILNFSTKLTELKIINAIDSYKNEDSDSPIKDNDSNSNNDYDYDDGFEKFLKVNNEKLINSINELNNLKSLEITNDSDLSYFSNFITIIPQYQFKPLNNFKINFLNLKEINKFLTNNPNIETIDIEILYPDFKKIKSIEEDFTFVKTEKIKMKKLFLNLCFSEYHLQKGYLNINTSTIQVIKIKDMSICNSSFKIFINNKISFDNLIEFELKNKENNSYKEEKQNILMKFVKNYNNYKKLKMITIIDMCIDENFINEFIKNNHFILTKLKLFAEAIYFGRNDNLRDYFMDLYPCLKFIDKVKIHVKN